MKPTYEELQLKLAAVVAENAGMKTVLEEIINADQPEYHDQGMGCGVEDRGYQRDGYSACYYGWESAMERVYSEVIPNSLPETPATDAYLAEVRVQGVEGFLTFCGEENSVFVEAKAYYRSLSDAVDEFAAQLRKGVQS